MHNPGTPLILEFSQEKKYIFVNWQPNLRGRKLEYKTGVSYNCHY